MKISVNELYNFKQTLNYKKPESVGELAATYLNNGS